MLQKSACLGEKLVCTQIAFSNVFRCKPGVCQATILSAIEICYGQLSFKIVWCRKRKFCLLSKFCLLTCSIFCFMKDTRFVYSYQAVSYLERNLDNFYTINCILRDPLIVWKSDIDIHSICQEWTATAPQRMWRLRNSKPVIIYLFLQVPIVWTLWRRIMRSPQPPKLN